MDGIVEIHTHQVATGEKGYYCTYVYLDGQQCRDLWLVWPGTTGTGSRVLTRDAVREWVKAGGEV